MPLIDKVFLIILFLMLFAVLRSSFRNWQKVEAEKSAEQITQEWWDSQW